MKLLCLAPRTLFVQLFAAVCRPSPAQHRDSEVTPWLPHTMLSKHFHKSFRIDVECSQLPGDSLEERCIWHASGINCKLFKLLRRPMCQFVEASHSFWVNQAVAPNHVSLAR
jgi:hypothetical protein